MTLKNLRVIFFKNCFWDLFLFTIGTNCGLRKLLSINSETKQGLITKFPSKKDNIKLTLEYHKRLNINIICNFTFPQAYRTLIPSSKYLIKGYIKNSIMRLWPISISAFSVIPVEILCSFPSTFNVFSSGII